MTPFFSFASLTYTRVARIHCKQRKKRNKETKKRKKKFENPNYCNKNESSLKSPENLKNCQTTPSYLVYLDIRKMRFFLVNLFVFFLKKLM